MAHKICHVYGNYLNSKKNNKLKSIWNKLSKNTKKALLKTYQDPIRKEICQLIVILLLYRILTLLSIYVKILIPKKHLLTLFPILDMEI